MGREEGSAVPPAVSTATCYDLWTWNPAQAVLRLAAGVRHGAGDRGQVGFEGPDGAPRPADGIVEARAAVR